MKKINTCTDHKYEWQHLIISNVSISKQTHSCFSSKITIVSCQWRCRPAVEAAEGAAAPKPKEGAAAGAALAGAPKMKG